MRGSAQGASAGVGAGPASITAPVAQRHLLVVLPHPDDESFSTGGTMALHADAGVPVTYLCGTFGDMGRNMGVPFFAHRESLRDVREAELRAACRILGADPRLMGLRDKTIEFEDPAELAGRVGAVIEETTPDLVITFYPGRGVHPDHDALGEATRRAVAGVPAAQRPRLWAVAVGEHEGIEAALGPPDACVDVAPYADRKRRALEAHASQTKSMFARMATGAKQDAHLHTRLEDGLRVERFYDLTPQD